MDRDRAACEGTHQRPTPPQLLPRDQPLYEIKDTKGGVREEYMGHTVLAISIILETFKSTCFKVSMVSLLISHG